MRHIVLLACLLIAGNVDAGQPVVAQRDAGKEIAGLIDALARSGCAFERNGKWYGAARAKSHLSSKYQWLRKRKLADTTEHFIERAASNSSRSGKPYHVRCAGKPSVQSAAWFRTELQRLRRQGLPAATR